MPQANVRIYFDFVDPLSYVASRALGLQDEGGGTGPPTDADWVGFELRPPPSPLTLTRDAVWTERWSSARKAAARFQLTLRQPELVPWTRKAHELHLLAMVLGVGDAVRAAVFYAYFEGGRDIGRVDVLVEIASVAGLDRTETKAVLDVDRHEADVTAKRLEAQALGVTDVPALSVDGRLVEGFPDLTGLGTLLPDR
jgi:predicted DsbA family dithiol-disulfide isomerase